jgi:hypothetical protein
MSHTEHVRPNFSLQKNQHCRIELGQGFSYTPRVIQGKKNHCGIGYHAAGHLITRGGENRNDNLLRWETLPDFVD